MLKNVKLAIRKIRILITNYRNITANSENDIHFLHIGKCAGSQLKHIADMCQKEGKVRLIKHEHFVRLDDLPRNSKYFFAIRNPESRFVSAFYSRKRKGAPKNYNEWSANECKAFSNFEHANDLAEALYEQGKRGGDALHAMMSIRHLNTYQIDWLKSLNRDVFNDDDLIGVIRQENFNVDLEQILKLLDLDLDGALVSEDEIVSHKNDYTGVPGLTSKAKSNLAQWYSQDFDFYERCVRLVKQ